MANKAYYFSHDSNAKDDPKCMLLIDQLGLEGYGIYWVLVEVLRDQETLKYPLNLVPILARRYNTTAEKMLTVIKKYGLFEVVDDEFFSLSLIKRMEKMSNIIEQKRLAGIASAEKRRLLKEATGAATDAQQPFNGCSTKKGKEKKGNEIKEKETKENSFLDVIQISEDLKPILIEWLEYKKSRKETYKREKSLQALANELTRLSNNDQATAKAIIQKSMANNWAGIFALKAEIKQDSRQGYKQEEKWND